MSFAPKIDYYGFDAKQSLKLSDSTEGRSNQTVTATNDEGSIIESEVFGETFAPSNSYKVTKCWTTDGLEVILGGMFTTTTYSGGSLTSALSNFTISTSAGGEPSVSASGEMCYKGTTPLPTCALPCTYWIKVYDLSPKRHAQVLGFAIASKGTTSGSMVYGTKTYPLLATDATNSEYVTNGYITQSDYDISSTIGRATVNGDTIAVDVTEGQISCTFTIQGIYSSPTTEGGSPSVAVPSVTVNEAGGWKITQPLTCTDPDANFPTWTIGCTYYIESKGDDKSVNPEEEPEEDTTSNS